ADCVKIGVREIMKDAPPDLIVSGLNQGQNVATNIIYSGTVSAATEGVILKLPSVALSLASFVSRDFATAAWIGASIVESVQKNSLPPRTLLNVNIPAVSKDKIKGIKVCRMGDSSFIECFDKRLDLRMQEYFWQGGKMNLVDEDADINYLRDNYVTVTPVHIDLTNHQFLPTLSKWDFNLKLNEV
ncbi:MAG: 5'/3'-nucleotidase SurE, partial [Nitrospinota bacterium]